MRSRTLDALRQQRLPASASVARNEATRSFAGSRVSRGTSSFLLPSTGGRLKQLLWCSDLFPAHAELAVENSADSGIVISCSWLLEDDPAQPERRSTPIRVMIQGDLVGVFQGADPETLKQLDDVLLREVARRMKRYLADLGLPVHRAPPPFEIRVGLGLLSLVERRRRVRAAA